MDDWSGYQKLVLAEIKRVSVHMDKVADDISIIKVELAMLKIKSGVWGLFGGLLTVFVVILSKKI